MIMEGKEVFRRAVRATVESAQTALERAKVTPDDIALFVPHQANIRIIEAVCSRLGIPAERIASSSTGPATPARRRSPWPWSTPPTQGRIGDGDLILLAGFGAGMTWASAVWRWGQ